MWRAPVHPPTPGWLGKCLPRTARERPPPPPHPDALHAGNDSHLPDILSLWSYVVLPGKSIRTAVLMQGIICLQGKKRTSLPSWGPPWPETPSGTPLLRVPAAVSAHTHLPEARWELPLVPKPYYCVSMGPCKCWLLRPGPHLLLYWNQFVQHGNFVTFLPEGNFLFQLYHCKVFFPGGRADHMCFSLFLLSFFIFINLGEGGLSISAIISTGF